jgi:hypothetical protein
MGFQTWAETLIASTVDGPTLVTSATATSLLPSSAKFVLPANSLYVGRRLRVVAWGRLSNIVTTPGTLALDVRFNSTPIVVFSGGAMQMSTTAHTTLPLRIIIDLTVRAIGSGTAANLMGQGVATGLPLSLTAVADSANDVASLMIPNTTPAVGTGFDSTVPNVVDLFGTFSISNAGNGITIHQYALEALN